MGTANGLELRRPARARQVSRIRLASAGQIGSSQLLGGRVARVVMTAVKRGCRAGACNNEEWSRESDQEGKRVNNDHRPRRRGSGVAAEAAPHSCCGPGLEDEVQCPEQEDAQGCRSDRTGDPEYSLEERLVAGSGTPRLIPPNGLALRRPMLSMGSCPAEAGSASSTLRQASSDSSLAESAARRVGRRSWRSPWT